MNVLIISQGIKAGYLDIIYKAIPENCNVTLITGSNIDIDYNIKVVKSPEHLLNRRIGRLYDWSKYSSFITWWSYKNSKKFDLIFATSNPPINAFLVRQLFKKKNDTKFIYMNWDIYPNIIEEAFTSLFVKFICKGWHKANNKIYEKVDKMITIGDTLAKSINSKLKNPIDIDVIPIPTDTERLIPIEKHKNPFVLENNLVDKFIVLFSGKMGNGQNIPFILDAAYKLKENKNICFVFIGKGPGVKLVEDYIKDRDNDSLNVKLFPFQPAEIFPFSMACGDIGLVSQRAELSYLSMPSKTYDMMSCGLAILGVCNGKNDLSYLINKYSVGEYVSTNNPEDLVKIILRLYKNQKLLNNYKKQAREIAVRYYNTDKILQMYKKTFEDVLGNN